MCGLSVPAPRSAPSSYPPDGGDRRLPDPPTIDLDQLERRIVGDSVALTSGAELAGAQAIWRDGRWWHTGLRVAGTTETR